ncbi:hypothetical protein N0V93_009091 [Gnomoniopsis smithogilvyi]|uniref:Histone-lysine N-methyltransferase n=1 Tax=Gnomoniopsis smithogilvyi TaxID=1191159 RepID=A0A9W8YK65_9PEZI|nr:hypothetical protein N0V93_009091 [Gnomoniopsis smithogilvyi]
MADDALTEIPPSHEALLVLPTPGSLDEPEPLRETTELPTPAADLNSEFSAVPTDASSNNASFSSTPPTILTDAASIASESSKPDLTTITATLASLDQSEPPERIEQTVEVGTPHRDQSTPQPTASDEKENVTPRRARSARSTTRTPVYNLAKLTGTFIHGKRRANGDEVRDKRRRTIPGAGGEARPLGSALSASPKNARGNAKSAAPTRRATRSSGGATTETVAAALTSLGKRGRKASEPVRVPRELRRLQDTNEFVGIEAKPVLHTIWSNGKYIDPNELDESGEPLHKKVRKNARKEVPKEEEEEASEEPEPVVQAPTKRVKKWLSKGLYAGQDASADYTSGLSAADKKKLAQFPELKPSGKINKTLPLPMFAGLRTLINGRDFKLPFDVCNPLPPGQPKPDEWRKMTKNRFVGDAGTYWRKTDHFKDYQSKCVCKPEDGCAEDCQNRIMLYECDETNCNVGKEHCQNRAFQNLTERTKKGGRFRVGVEVLKTADRGHGVRSNRCFEPNQIIMEYTGEIITEAECERRMNEKYKDNECYYLMAFDQNMIIDATTGSIARFVNHSCDPNCRMEKWIVHGQPRMALFAGDKPIMTGEELTYDYNFDPFSAKNVQKCLCGSANCRGVLGPKVSKLPKGEAKNVIKETVKAATKAGKRKLQALLGGENDTAPNKKRKIAKATGAKRSLGAKATAVVKKTASSISVNAKAALAAASQPKKSAVSISVRKATLVKASKVYNKNGKQLLLADTIVSNASTIVATPKAAPKKKKVTPKASATKASPAKSKAKPKSKPVAKAKTASKSTIKATIKSAGVKGSIRGTVKTAKHTISKTAGKKTVKKTTRVAKQSILASPEESVPAEGGSISVKGPRKALELSRTQNKIRVVTDIE